MHTIPSENPKKPFSQLVKQAVDDLGIRDYYKGADDSKIAKHVKELMDVLLTTHNRVTQQQLPPAQSAPENTGTTILVNTENSSQNTALQKFTENKGIEKIYHELPKIMRNNPTISPHDRLLCQTVMDLMIELQFKVENDIDLQADMITEIITTTRVPDRKQVRHFIDKKGDEQSVGFADREKQSGRLGVEKLYASQIQYIPGDFGIDPRFKKLNLHRIVQDGINKLSHTPFEYFHEFQFIKTNKEDKPVYLLRTYTHYDKTTDRNGSILTFLDKEYNFLNPNFPVIDDSQSNTLIFINAFGNYDIGRYAGGLFFRYKDQLFLIKNGKYARPDFADQITEEKFYHVKIYEENRGYYSIHTNKDNYLTDSYFRVLGRSIEEVKALLKQKSKKKKEK